MLYYDKNFQFSDSLYNFFCVFHYYNLLLGILIINKKVDGATFFPAVADVTEQKFGVFIIYIKQFLVTKQKLHSVFLYNFNML